MKGRSQHFSETACPPSSPYRRSQIQTETTIIAYNAVRCAIQTGQVAATEADVGFAFRHKPAGLYALGMEATMHTIGIHEALFKNLTPVMKDLLDAVKDDSGAYQQMALNTATWLEPLGYLLQPLDPKQNATRSLLREKAGGEIDLDIDPLCQMQLAASFADKTVRFSTIPALERLFSDSVDIDIESLRRSELDRLPKISKLAVNMTSLEIEEKVAEAEMLATAIMC